MPARSSAARLPREPGVHRFRDRRGRILYLGRATDLRSRVRSYWGDLRDRAHLAEMVARVARVEAVACGSAHEAAWLERSLLEAAMPPWNRGQGGARLAVSGLLRAYPLAYTRDRLTAAGRDLASGRGVGPRDRERLAAAVAAPPPEWAEFARRNAELAATLR